MKRVPLEGKTFGKWKVLSYEGCTDGKKSYYQCQCMGCNQIYSIRADRLTCGRTNRCLQCRIAEDRAYGRKPKHKCDADEKDQTPVIHSGLKVEPSPSSKI